MKRPLRYSMYVFFCMFCLSFYAHAQNTTITGKVISMEDGEALPGVSVKIKNTNVGVTTNVNGQYSINVPESATTLVFSFVGMTQEEVSIQNRSNINVSLAPDIQQLTEVVVVGFGTESRKLLKGSVSQVKSEQIRDLPVASLDGALQGQAAGVNIVQNSGTPGGAMNVTIRGNSSISGGNQPLYVIDGVPMTTGDFSQVGFGGQGTNALADINPDDIASISVLKDAEAGALYGARAANGVVLITTKRGEAGQSKISFNAFGGFQEPWNMLDMLNSSQWKSYRNDLATGRGADPIFSQEQIDNPRVNTDWLDQVFRQARIQSYELASSGGNEKTQYYVSANYFDQEGIVRGTRYERFSFRTNLDHKVNERLKVGSNINFSYAKNDRVEGDQSLHGPVPNAITLPSIYPIFNDDGTYNQDGPFANPVAIYREALNEAHTFRNISQFFAEYDILPNLQFATKTALDYMNLRETSYDPVTTRQGERDNGLGFEANNEVMNITNYNTLTWNNSYGNHDIEVLGGYSFERFYQRTSFIRGNDFPNENFQNLASAAVISDASASGLDRSINSFFGRIRYDYLNKYLFSFNARYDGSSKFGRENQYGFFPAAAAAWRLSEENFMAGNATFSELKIRASYGLTGNDGIGDFSSPGLFGASRYLGQSALIPIQLENPELRWETTRQANIGIDAGFVNDRINVTLDLYHKFTTDLLINRPVTSTSGFGSIAQNIGEVLNQGIELGITSENIVGGDFTWSTNFNIAHNTNRVITLFDGQAIDNIGRGSNRIEEGQPIGIFFGFESLGVDPSTGDIVFRDVNFDGQITAADRTKIGDPNPLFFGGITNNFKYKNWDLTVFFQGSYGNDIFNGSRIFIESMKGNDNQSADIERRWRQPGDITDIPRATESDPNINNRISSRFIEDGSYLRLKNLTLGYNLPSDLIRSWGLSRCRVYFSGQNLLTFTNYSGLDPEVNYSGVSNQVFGTDFFTYPQARTYTLGINVDF
ncbi:MAG: TonB-dependent receptor [Cyclobacteriaceae bacterium]|nr:TonB-dependent receptor [Cyclobacteriaceae bacterium]